MTLSTCLSKCRELAYATVEEQLCTKNCWDVDLKQALDAHGAKIYQTVKLGVSTVVLITLATAALYSVGAYFKVRASEKDLTLAKKKGFTCVDDKILQINKDTVCFHTSLMVAGGIAAFFFILQLAL